MNAIKAREYFSAYYENSLDRGLRDSFERRLAEDSGLKAEYDEFARMLDALGPALAREVEPPIDLHETIMRRVDRHLYDQEQTRRPAVWPLWRSLSVGAVATLAILATVLTISADGRQAVANLFGIGAGNGAKLELTVEGGDPAFVYRSGRPARFELADDSGASPSKQFVLGGDDADVRLENPSASARVFTIRALDAKREIRFALPGRKREVKPVGEGDARALAVALAGYYRTPVLIEVADLSARTTWTLSGSVADAPGAQLGNAQFAILVRGERLLCLIQRR